MAGHTQLSDDIQHAADRVGRATRELNGAMLEAARAGLSVSLETSEPQRFGITAAPQVKVRVALPIKGEG